MKILIVDDSRAMRMIVRRALRQAGYGAADVQEAENGAEGLKVVATFSPDLVFCDWNMPVMGGLEFLQNLNAQGKHIPFGFVTSEATHEVRQAGKDAGARFFILKPFAPESFQDALDSVFKGATKDVFQVRVAAGTEAAGQILPNVQNVADTLTGLIGKPITAMDWRAGIEPGIPVVYAIFTIDGAVSHVFVGDLSFAGFTSGAMALMQDVQVKKAVEAKKLPENLLDMTREVFNVLARLFNDAAGHQPKLDKVLYSPTPLPPDAAAIVKAPGAAAHMVVNVPGYGKGKLSGLAKKA